MNEHNYTFVISVFFMAIYRLCGIPGVTVVAGVIVVAGDGVGDASTAEGERFAGGSRLFFDDSITLRG